MTVDMGNPESLDLKTLVKNLADRDLQKRQWKPAHCTGCSLEGEQRCLDEGPPVGDLDVLLIVERPTKEDTAFDRAKLTFASNQWITFYTLVSRILQESSLTYRVHYALLCSGGTPKVGDFRRCAKYLDAKVSLLRPKVIIAFGVSVLRALGFKDTSISSVRGEIRSMPIKGTDRVVHVIPTFPEKVYIHWEYKFRFLDMLETEVRKAAHIANFGYKPFDPAFMDKNCKLVYDEDDAVALIESVTDKPDLIVPWDTETARPGLNRERWLQHFHPEFEVTIFSFCVDGVGIAIDLRKMGDKVWSAIRALMVSRTKKGCHHGKFDKKALRAFKGIDVLHTEFDSMYNAYLLNENRGGDAKVKFKYEYTLKRMLWDYPELWDIAGYEGELVEKIFSGKIVFKEEHWEIFMKYAAMDSLALNRLKIAQDRALNRRTFKEEQAYYRRGLKVPATTTLYDISHGLITQSLDSVTNMEVRGWAVDMHKLGLFSAQAHAILDDRKEKLKKAIGPDFDFKKNRMIAKYLFEDKGLVCPKRTKTGGLSVEEDVLVQLVDECPEVRHLVDARRAKKLLDFIAAVENNMSPDGRVHAEYMIEGTKTGRLSCINPNIQQITDRIGVGKFDKVTQCFEQEFNVKELYVASPGMTLICADYAQMEIVILACYVAKYAPNDTALIKAIEKGYDIHSFNAAQMFGHTYEEVNTAAKDETHPEHRKFKTLRSAAKAVTFAIVYGSEAKGMGEKQGVSESTAQAWIDKMLGLYPGIGLYIPGSHSMARSMGYVDTFFGRRRRLPLYKWTQYGRKGHAASNRIAQNTRIQSSANDVCLTALILLDGQLPSVGGGVLGTVHDSIIAEVPEDRLTEGCSIFRHCMVDAPTEMFRSWLKAPLRADLESGPSWGNLRKVQ